MKTATVGNNVQIHYTGTLVDGTEFDSSRKRGETMAIQVGAPGIIKGFTDALIGMTEGETKSITLEASEAYGERDENAIQPVPMAAFGPDFNFIIGETVQGNGAQGPFLATIQALEEEAQQVLLDFNHPLAGETLTFNIEMVAIDDTDTTTGDTETDTDTETTTDDTTTTTTTTTDEGE
jgi:peptidylprolyl isomerase